MSLAQSAQMWFRTNFRWSNSRESWIERAVTWPIFLATILLVWYAPLIDLKWLFGLTALLIIVATAFARTGHFKFLGPVLLYDMIRSSRRVRYFLLRLVYAGFLVLLLAWCYLATGAMHFSIAERSMASQIAMNYFQAYMICQFILVLLLTPAYVAGAIAEEKDRKTIEYLLTTDLDNREIVLSKLLSRLANLSLLILTGLPILSFLQFLGGVDPNLVWLGFGVTALTMLGVGSVSILQSVYYKKPRDAIVFSYLAIVAYFAISTPVYFVCKWVPPGLTFLNERLWPDTVFGIALPYSGDVPTIANLGEGFGHGNLIVLISRILWATMAGAPAGFATTLPVIFEDYAWFHIPLAILCIWRSIWMLRPVALKQSYGQVAKANVFHKYRPPIGRLPMLWKEIHVETLVKFNWMSIIMFGVLLTATLGTCPLVWYVIDQLFWQSRFGLGFHDLPEAMNIWCRFAGAGVACLTILGVAVRASSAVSTERDRETFDALITTPMSAHQILGAKFLGSLCSIRMGWFWLGTIWGLAYFFDGLHVFALPLVLFSWVVYSSFFAMVGLWFSMVSATSLRATVYTVLTTLALWGGHWLITGFLGCFYALLMQTPGDRELFEYLIKFQAGNSPPFVIGWLAYCGKDLSRMLNHRESWELFCFCLLGLFLWLMASLVMWFVFLVPRFRAISGRDQTSSDEE